MVQKSLQKSPKNALFRVLGRPEIHAKNPPWKLFSRVLNPLRIFRSRFSTKLKKFIFSKKNSKFLENIAFMYSFCRELNYLQNETIFLEIKIIFDENIQNKRN